MSNDDEAARRNRSESLRAQISKYKKREGDEQSVPEDPEDKSHAGKSPREFIQERMRELDKEKDKDKV